MTLKNGMFSIELDIQDFEPDDIDIKVQGGDMVLVGRREIKRGSKPHNEEIMKIIMEKIPIHSQTFNYKNHPLILSCDSKTL